MKAARIGKGSNFKEPKVATTGRHHSPDSASAEVVTCGNDPWKRRTLNHTSLISPGDCRCQWLVDRRGSASCALGPAVRTAGRAHLPGGPEAGQGGGRARGRLVHQGGAAPTWRWPPAAQCSAVTVGNGGPCSRGSVWTLTTTPQEEEKVSHTLSSDNQVITHEGLVPLFPATILGC